MSKINNTERVRQFLQQGPAKAATLLEVLNISQPTFSRLWSSVPNGVVLGASKARQYALRRQVPGVDAPIPVFRVAVNGRIDPIGRLDVLQGGFYALTPLAGTRYALHQGMPLGVLAFPAEPANGRVVERIQQPEVGIHGLEMQGVGFSKIAIETTQHGGWRWNRCREAGELSGEVDAG